MKFDLTDLKLFIAVVEQKNLTQGAKQVFLAPSSASHRIKLLEDNLGTQLLERQPRGVSATKAGEIVLRYAKRTLATLEQMQSDIAPFTKGALSQVKLWANTNAIHTYLPEDLGTFLENNQGVRVALEEHTSEEIITAVAQGEVELGIVAENGLYDNVEFYPYKKDRLVIIVPSEHSLAKFSKIQFSQAVSFPFVILNEGSAIHTFMMNKAAGLNCHLNIRAQVKSFDAVCRMVGSGVGIALLPYDSIGCWRSLDIKIIEVDEKWSKRNLTLCIKKGAQIGALSKVLFDHLRGEP
ncbi:MULTISPECIES: LysR family transcriptional regulator [Pseudoalteromonas]|jgi:DNA-binding transcriptional LysR family regulator|uniref:LysR family transcriptional regulator n=1 Tax=Pseudoalteromonas lipolytica TaxID=570156 RepID=A0A0N8HK66_9GAMM|nr:MULTISPECIES: LysR family transcriptional regulator [Pseudoalteromonas]KPM83024.1 LysR family transcriptional regulator [Pseudoalteromonas lipolytica]MCF2917602.1 LysR family transcriptional regulator [Pseudoalteromonas sp. Cn5-37]TMP14235.1 LysR family transcriptional regulator [Pseudoalteromonas sp. S2721]|tara:strand:- start:2105 stop:2989 length:885 start_codon:yes stop_codon:yes gene_type:complete